METDINYCSEKASGILSSFRCAKIRDLCLEGEQKKSAQTVLSLEAISWAKVLQIVKISYLLLDFLIRIRKFNSKQLIQMR